MYLCGESTVLLMRSERNSDVMDTVLYNVLYLSNVCSRLVGEIFLPRKLYLWEDSETYQVPKAWRLSNHQNARSPPNQTFHWIEGKESKNTHSHGMAMIHPKSLLIYSSAKSRQAVKQHCLLGSGRKRQRERERERELEIRCRTPTFEHVIQQYQQHQ